MKFLSRAPLLPASNQKSVVLMKNKPAAPSTPPKKQPVVVKDLKAKKNPKGGATASTATTGTATQKASIFDRWGNL
jgi:hypothetical protein